VLRNAPHYLGHGKLKGSAARRCCWRAEASAASRFGSTRPTSKEQAESLEDLDDRRLHETRVGYLRTRAALPHSKPGASIINAGCVTGLRGSAHLVNSALELKSTSC
jgi:hypothetical protein